MISKIDLRCPECGRKEYNMEREEFDPEDAVLAVFRCPDCCMGDKSNDTEWFNTDGIRVDWVKE